MALNKQRQGLNCKVFNENVCIFTACIISYLWLISYFNTYLPLNLVIMHESMLIKLRKETAHLIPLYIPS